MPPVNDAACPPELSAAVEVEPLPPAGISATEVMAALGLEGWRWLWAYRDWAKENEYRAKAAHQFCKGLRK